MPSLRFKIVGTTGEQMAKRMMKLAWDRSGVFGLGVIQDRGPGMSEDQVWKNVSESGDYASARTSRRGEASADYVFGRMMKLHFRFGDDWVEGSDGAYRTDYQSFCRTYPDFASLVKAAADSLGAKIEQGEQPCQKN